MAHKFTITMKPDANPDDVAAELQSQGFTVEEIMREINVISVSGENDATSVQSMRGVAAVEESADFQIPPPDAPIQ